LRIVVVVFYRAGEFVLDGFVGENFFAGQFGYACPDDAACAD